MSQQNLITEPERDVLEEGLLHHALVFFHLPARLPGWAIWVLSLMLASLPVILWYTMLEDIQIALSFGTVLWIFMATDMIVLQQLPKKHISFGPWKSQFLALALPRVFVAFGLSPAILLIGWQWTFAVILLAQMVGTAALFWGALIEPFRLALTEYDLTTDRLPPDASPIRLLHISDLHVERLTRREQALLELVDEAKPDLIVITGDYVNLSYNRDPVTHAQVKKLLEQLSAPNGVYATLGSPPVDVRDAVVSLFDDLPVSLMRDEWTTVHMGPGRELVLVGLDCTHHLPTDEASLDRVMKIAPNGVPQVLLYHSPELMPQASGHGIDLYLCGHTHGGQVRLPIIGPILTSSQLGRDYVMGLYQRGRTRLYVSRGVGLEGLSAPRVRFLSPPEITLFTLRGG